MGNACECVCRQTDDDAEDALLADFEREMTGSSGQPRGPPPPYQLQAPVYFPQMTQQQQLQLVQRLTLIQCLPSGRYEAKKGSEKKGDNKECPICMMDFVVGEPIRLLPCMHFYHLRCIDDWLMRSFTCPTCMQPVDIALRNTVRPFRGCRRRRRRFGSSSSTTSSSSSSSSHSSTEHLLCQQPSSEQLGPDVGSLSQQRTVSPPTSPPPGYLHTSPSPPPIIEIH